MKKMYSTILLIACASFLFAQTPKKGEYRRDDKLDKFIGTWEGSNENEILKIILKREKIYVKGMDFYMDVAIGWHEFIRDGKIIESSFDFVNNGYDKETTILGGSDDETKLRITVFRDLTRKRNSGGELKLIDNNNGILSLWFNEQVLINKKSVITKEAIPTPSEWIMKKID